MDGPVGDLMRRTDISYFRPAHVHFLIDEPGYQKLITHLFQESSEYLDSDVVFGTKDALIVRFAERPAGVAPDGSRLEEPYLQRDIEFTRQAFGLTSVQVRAYDPKAALGMAEIDANQDTIGNIRLWDWQPLQQTFRSETEKPGCPSGPLSAGSHSVHGRPSGVASAQSS